MLGPLAFFSFFFFPFFFVQSHSLDDPKDSCENPNKSRPFSRMRRDNKSEWTRDQILRMKHRLLRGMSRQESQLKREKLAVVRRIFEKQEPVVETPTVDGQASLTPMMNHKRRSMHILRMRT